MIANFMKDPTANSLAVIVLIALVISFIGSLLLMLRESPVSQGKGWYTGLLLFFPVLGLPSALDLLQSGGLASGLASIFFIALGLSIVMSLLSLSKKSSQKIVAGWHQWAIPVLVMGGLAVAGYLAFVESTHVETSCGPVGNCGTVQHSPYAVLFGFLPVGLLGFSGYAVILLAWLVGRRANGAVKKWSALTIWGLCIFGVFFSAYLTFLEPFVIGATCMWCIASAVLMILLLWVATPRAQEALTIDKTFSSSDLEPELP